MIKVLFLLTASTVPAVQAASIEAPKRAAIGANGYATILDAPPAPYTPLRPQPPQPATPEQIEAQRQMARAAEFQSQVRDEVTALAERLRVAERGNFVDLYFDNDGEPSAVFQFLRDGPATLGKYTSHPRFRAETVRYSKQELLAAMDFMLETFRHERVIESGGIGAGNAVTIRIRVPEEEFRTLIAGKGVKIPEAVKLEFPVKRTASEVNAPLPEHIAPLVRVFARDNRPDGALPSTSRTVKVVLRDGCFRVAGDHYDGAHVLFPLGAQLFVDSEGYLAYGSGEAPGYARVGETIVTPGTIGEISAPALAEPIRAACGAGTVIKVHGMSSAAADQAQFASEQNARALRDFKQMYGLSEPVAANLLERCKQHAGGAVCLLSPPPPVRRQEDCPENTTLSGGLCRTPEGVIRPLPKWLQDLLPNS